MSASIAKLTAVVLLTGALWQPVQADWVSFHNGGGNRPDVKKLPVTWSPDRGIAWQVDVPGYGQSTPVVWKNQVFVTSIEGLNKEWNLVTCLSARDGKIIWKQRFPASHQVPATDYTSRAAPSPCVDDRAVYCWFESGDFHALRHNGETLWQKSLAEFGKLTNKFGLAGSPAQNRDLVFVLVEDGGANYLVALEKQSGKLRWRQDREKRSSYSSPILVKVGDREELIISSAGIVEGLNPANGERRWRLDGLSGNVAATPMVDGDMVYIGATMDPTEGATWTAQESNCALRLLTRDGKPTYELVWKGDKEKKITCGLMGPLVHRGLLYTLNPAGVVYCLDAKSGKELYSQRLPVGQTWAQALGFGDHVYFFGKSGVISVIKAGPSYEAVAVNRLWTPENPPLPAAGTVAPGQAAGGPLDPAIYGVAAAHDSLFVRVGTRVYRVQG